LEKFLEFSGLPNLPRPDCDAVCLHLGSSRTQSKEGEHLSYEFEN